MNAHQLDRAAHLYEVMANDKHYEVYERDARGLWKNCCSAVRERDANERIDYAHEGSLLGAAVLQDSDKRLIEHRYKEMEKEWEYRTQHYNQ